jgi:hypothetical protein
MREQIDMPVHSILKAHPRLSDGAPASGLYNLACNRADEVDNSAGTQDARMEVLAGTFRERCKGDMTLIKLGIISLTDPK